MRCPFPVRGLRGVLYSPSVRDTYLDTWPMEPTLIAARTRPSIAGLRSSSRVKCITLPLQIMYSVGRIGFLVWTGDRVRLPPLGDQ